MSERRVHGYVALRTTGTQSVSERQHVGGAPDVSEVSFHAPAAAHAPVLRALHDDHVIGRGAGCLERLPLATLLQRCERGCFMLCSKFTGTWTRTCIRTFTGTYTCAIACNRTYTFTCTCTFNCKCKSTGTCI